MKRKSEEKKRNSAPPAANWRFVEKILDSPNAHTIYLWGPSGIGKTYTACRKGAGDRDVFVITLTPETPAAELRGFWMPRGDEFVWQDGVFVEAMRKGARIVINEISHASHDVLAILHPVLESRETAQLTLPNLETIRPADGFQVICTDNLPPTQLPPALYDRFLSIIHVNRPHPEALSRLPADLREAAQRTFDLESERAVSLRGWLSVLEFEKEFGREDAFRVVFGRERGEQIYGAILLGGA